MTSAQPNAAPVDLQKVGQFMAKLKVPGLPRNYQLFHEALFGFDNGIGADILALGPHPSQAMLDEVGLKHHLVSHCGLVADKSAADAARMLREVADRLAEGLQKKQHFAQTVETVAHSVAEGSHQSLAAFSAEMDYLNASLTNLMLYETELTERLREEVDKLEALDRGSTAARTAAATDRVTGLPNQIALMNRLTEAYDSVDEAGFAVMMVDVDDFRAFNAKYGPMPANQLMKKLGALFRKSIKKNDFVARMSGDDFCFMFSDVGIDSARAIAARLRTSVEEATTYTIPGRAEPGRLTISIGIALSANASAAAQLVGHAQTALVTAQANHRQPVHVFTHELAA